MSALERLRKVLRPIDRHRLCAAIATLAGMYVANGYSRQNYRIIVDDALISLVYARNLALGNGLVFNVGERVEGYTNFLWVLLIAPFYWVARLFHADFVHFVIGLSIALSGIALVLVYRLSRAIWDRNLVATGAALGLCVVDNSYTTWAGAGPRVPLTRGVRRSVPCTSRAQRTRGVFCGWGPRSLAPRPPAPTLRCSARA